MKKNLGAVSFVAAVAAGLLVFAAAVGAQTATSTTPSPLTATCAGSVSGMSIAWTSSVAGGVPPYSYVWSGANLTATSASVTASYAVVDTYTATLAVKDLASSTVSATCSARVVPPSPAPAPMPFPVKFVSEPVLQINPSGHFLARGMVVQSVSGDSFTGQVWGVTYTVNMAAAAYPVEFYMRHGNVSVSSTMNQLAVGDEVGVQGVIASSAPLVVNAAVVRNYSITVPRPDYETPESESDHNGNYYGGGMMEKRGENEGEGEGHGMMKGNAPFVPPASGSTTEEINQRLNELFKQLQSLRSMMGGDRERGD